MRGIWKNLTPLGKKVAIFLLTIGVLFAFMIIKFIYKLIIW